MMALDAAIGSKTYTQTLISATFPCLRGYGKSKWPIRDYAPLDTTVNAFHGGCAGLIQCSNTYGADGSHTTYELLLYRAGFQGNHFSVASLVKGNQGHFGAQNNFRTDEHGKLIGDLMFGTNHVSLISNDPKHGNLTHGILVKSAEDEDGTVLPLDVNGEGGAGSTLTICSSVERGAGDVTVKTAIYTTRSGHKDNHQETKLLVGDDLWKFGLADKLLKVTGPLNSTYGMYHNREECIDLTYGGLKSEEKVVNAHGYHAATLDGETSVRLTPLGSESGALVLLCSNSNSELSDDTCAALYFLCVSPGQGVTSKFVKGIVGGSYSHPSADLWAVKESSGFISVQGPKGPCRYGFISNMTAKEPSLLENLCSPYGCLATGQADALRGAVKIDDISVVGWVNRACDVKIYFNEKETLMFKSEELKEVVSGRWAFCHTWTKEEERFELLLVGVKARTTVEGKFMQGHRNLTWEVADW